MKYIYILILSLVMCSCSTTTNKNDGHIETPTTSTTTTTSSLVTTTTKKEEVKLFALFDDSSYKDENYYVGMSFKDTPYFKPYFVEGEYKYVENKIDLKVYKKYCEVANSTSEQTWQKCAKVVDDWVFENVEDETFLHNTEYSEYSYWNEIKGTVRGTINDAKEFDEVIKSIQVLCEVPNYANFERVMGHWVGYSYEIGSKEYSVGMYYLPENSNYAYLTINYRDLSISSESHDTYTAFVDISEFKVRFEEYVRNNVLQENINDFQKN